MYCWEGSCELLRGKLSDDCWSTWRPVKSECIVCSLLISGFQDAVLYWPVNSKCHPYSSGVFVLLFNREICSSDGVLGCCSSWSLILFCWCCSIVGLLFELKFDYVLMESYSFGGLLTFIWSVGTLNSLSWLLEDITVLCKRISWSDFKSFELGGWFLFPG